jgi:hypothetical protein
MPPAPKKTAPEPPVEAVARDPHWMAKLDRLRRRSLARTRLRLWDDPDLRVAYEDLRSREARARLIAAGSSDDEAVQAVAKEAAEQLAAAERAADEMTEPLVFQALPGDHFEALIRQHPPTEEQAEQGEDFNTKTFPAVLIAAAAVDPMTVEDAQEILAAWGPTDRADLFAAALSVQQQRRTDLGKG